MTDDSAVTAAELERAQAAILQIRKALTGDIHSTSHLLDDIAALRRERDEALKRRIVYSPDAQAMSDRVRSLEAQLDESEDRAVQAAQRNVTLRADIAKKDAALRGVENFARQIATHFPQSAQTLLEITDLALAPAAQGEYSPEQWTEYQRQHTAANPLNVARAAAPAPSAGETSDLSEDLQEALERQAFRRASAPSAGDPTSAVIEECAKAAHDTGAFFERNASLLVSAEYREGYNEACEHIERRIRALLSPNDRGEA